MTNPIYEASIEDRLLDLKRTIDSILSSGMLEDLRHDFLPHYYADDSFAIGNWLVRPRFPEPEPACKFPIGYIHPTP